MKEVALVVIVPRHTAALGFPPLGEVWADTRLSLPAREGGWRDVFTGRTHADGSLPLAEILSALPFAVLSGS